MLRTLQNLMLCFLILPLLLACQAQPINTDFDGHWEIINTGPDNTPKGCLNEEDIVKLKTILNRCEAVTP